MTNTRATHATQANIDYGRVAAAIRFLDANAPSQPSLEDVARHLGLSRSHLQRTFTRWAGTSPKRFLQFVTATGARERLRGSAPVLDTTLASGLSSPGRLHDLMVTIDAMTPGEVARGGEGLRIAAGRHPTAFGDVLVGVTDRGVCLLEFVDVGDDRGAVAAIHARWPRASVHNDPGVTWEAVRPVFATDDAPVRLHVQGTNLQLKVWEALLRIPAGTVTSYGALAESVEHPTAVRAVASAVAKNPVAYLIPCHRVIRSTGHLGGYAWGLERKRLLLAREAAGRRGMS